MDDWIRKRVGVLNTVLKYCQELYYEPELDI